MSDYSSLVITTSVVVDQYYYVSLVDFLQEAVRIEQEKMLTTKEFDPDTVVESILENQPKAMMNGKACTFIMPPAMEDL